MMVTDGVCISSGSLIACRDSDCAAQGHSGFAVLLLPVSASTPSTPREAVLCADLSLGCEELQFPMCHVTWFLLCFKCILNLKSVPRLYSLKPNSTMGTLQL